MGSFYNAYLLHQLMHTQPNIKIVYVSMEYTAEDIAKRLMGMAK